MTKEEIYRRITFLRKELEELAEKEIRFKQSAAEKERGPGWLKSPETLRLSRKLDRLINEYMK